MACMAKPIGADRKRLSANLPQALGAELTKRRMAAGWSQQKLADKLGFTINYIGQIERAEKSPTLATLINLATVYKVPLSVLIRSAEMAATPMSVVRPLSEPSTASPLRMEQDGK